MDTVSIEDFEPVMIAFNNGEMTPGQLLRYCNTHSPADELTEDLFAFTRLVLEGVEEV